MSDSSPTSRDAHTSGSHFQPSTSVVFIIVVLFVAATFLMVRAASPSTSAGTTIPSTALGSTTTTTTIASHPGIKKSQVRVQVANGTLTTGLSARITQSLQIQGWDTLPPGNGPRVTATVVYYNPGYQTYAAQIAATIHVPATAVQPLNGGNPIAGSSSDDVIVVLGPNSAIG